MLRITSIVLLLVHSQIVVAQESSKPKWSRVLPADRFFTILLPGKPSRTTKTLDGKEGKVELQDWIVARTKTLPLFQFTHSTCPTADPNPKACQARLRSAQTIALEEMKGQLISVRHFRLLTHPGKELRFKLRDGRFAFVKFLAVREHLFELLVVGTKEEMERREVRIFFRSFRLFENDQ